MKVLKCEYCETCLNEVTNIDEKGFIYCKYHGEVRKQSKRCRKMRVYEINRLKSGLKIKKY